VTLLSVSVVWCSAPDRAAENPKGTTTYLAVVAEGAFWHLDAPVRRVAAMDVPIPFSPVLEDETVPTPERVIEVALELVGKKR